MIELSRARFEQLVADALDSLPPQLRTQMSNVQVTVDDGDDPYLLGLYRGIPLTERTSDYAAVLPDRITIFQRAICALAETEPDVVAQVRTTVVHEVGHHFGIDDDRLRELGW